MTSKEIGRSAGRIFQKAIPENCAIRNQEDQEDYGIDYELELTDKEDHATGFIFKVQQKGVATLKANADGKTVSYSELKVTKARYYLMQCRIPVAFVLVDVATGAVFWTMLQGNANVREAYDSAVASRHETMTVRLQVGNCLPATFDKLLDAIRETNQWLIVQGVKEVSSMELLEAALRGADLDAAAKAIALHHDIFRSEQIEQQIRSQQFERAVETAEKIFNSASESTLMRFSAAWSLFKIKPLLLLNSNDPERAEKIKIWRLTTAEKLFKICQTKGTERRLRLFALFLRRAARLKLLVEQDFALFLSRHVQQESGNAFIMAMTDKVRMPFANATVLELRRLQQHFLWMIRKRNFELVAPAWILLVQDVMPFIMRLRAEGLDESAGQLAQWLDNTGNIAIEISKSLKNWNEVAFCALSTIFVAAPLTTTTREVRFTRAKEIIESIPDETVRKKALVDLAEFREKEQKQDITPDDEVLIFRQMATAMGVDLANKSDEVAQIINIGLRDLNPERVLRNCRHLFVQIVGGGVPAQMLGLQTAGFKTLYCTKFGHGWGALELDAAYNLMKREHCEKCKSCEPHPVSWKWNREWQEQQNKLHGTK
jgi:hypothetical protein